MYCVACGKDVFSYGVLWPITQVNSVAEVFCTEINPLFGFGPYATRNCTSNNVWGGVDTSQCSIRLASPLNTVVYSDFITLPSIEANVTSIPASERVSYYILSTSVSTFFTL